MFYSCIYITVSKYEFLCLQIFLQNIQTHNRELSSPFIIYFCKYDENKRTYKLKIKIKKYDKQIEKNIQCHGM